MTNYEIVEKVTFSYYIFVIFWALIILVITFSGNQLTVSEYVGLLLISMIGFTLSSMLNTKRYIMEVKG